MTQALNAGAQIGNERRRTENQEEQFAITAFQSAHENMQKLKVAKQELQVRQTEASQRLQYLQNALEQKQSTADRNYELGLDRIDMLGQKLTTDAKTAADKLDETKQYDSDRMDALRDRIDQQGREFETKEKDMSDRQAEREKAAKDLQDARNSGKDGSLVDVTSGSGPDNKTTRKVPVDQYNEFVRTQGRPGAPTIDTFLSTNQPAMSQPPMPPPTAMTAPVMGHLTDALRGGSTPPPVTPSGVPAGMAAVTRQPASNTSMPTTAGNLPPTPTRDDINALAKYPQLKDHFEAQFGKGSADQWLP